MQYKETLLWILDKDRRMIPGRKQTLAEQEEKFRQNIDFVHALGLKCDAVGWCEMDLGRPDIDGILSRIEDFCRRENWGVRAWYTREFTGESDWFALKTTEFKDNADGGRFDGLDREGKKLYMMWIKAYADLIPGPRETPNYVAVPERFRQVCIHNNIPCDFFWLEDRGKWDGKQYFCLVPTQSVSRAAVSGYKFPGENPPEMVDSLGGMLPRVMELCYEVWDVRLPQVFRASDLPEGGIVCANLPNPGIPYLPPTILIHRSAAEQLIEEKALSRKDLQPVPVVEEFPAGYRIRETQPLPLPGEKYIADGMAAYETLKAHPRPVRQITEKDALKLLRAAKKERKSDFGKGMTKLDLDCPLLPYWKIAGSGFLSEEYELLSPAASKEKTEEFLADMAKEELLEQPPRGLVFAVCPDGDSCLLTPEGAVERWSHEGPSTLEVWPTLAQFFGDSLQS